MSPSRQDTHTPHRISGLLQPITPCSIEELICSSIKALMWSRVETRLNQPWAIEDDQSDLSHVNMTHLCRTHIVDGPQIFPLSPTQSHGRDMGRTRYLSGMDPVFRDSPPRVEINSDPGYGRMGSDFCCAIADLSAVSIYPPVLRDEP